MKLNDTTTGADFNLPYDLSEISFRKYTASIGVESRYLKLKEKVEQENKDPELEDEIEEGDTYEIPADLVPEYLLEYNAAFLDGDLGNIPHSLEEDAGRNLIGENYMVNLGEEISQERIYAHLNTLLSTHVSNLEKRYKENPRFRPSKYKVNINGETFCMESSRAKRLFLEEAYTTGEVVELKEWRRKLGNAINKKGDPEGMFAFNMGALEMAILLRKEGEDLPFRKDEREKFLDERAKLMYELTLATVFEVRFFLILILSDLLPRTIMSTFSQMRQTLQKQPSEKPKHEPQP